VSHILDPFFGDLSCHLERKQIPAYWPCAGPLILQVAARSCGMPVKQKSSALPGGYGGLHRH
jgi:hypothetical protein